MSPATMDLPQVLAKVVLAATSASNETIADPPVNMPPNVADIYFKMLYVQAGLWFIGVISTLSFAWKNWATCVGKSDENKMNLSLRASLYGISNVPVPMRFYRNQGDRWVNVCSFGLTVSALANLTATLLFGATDLGGPNGLFYFYSYFIIFILFALIYWPMFISRNQVHRFRGRVYGLVYSGVMLGTVIITSVFTDQPRAYTMVLNLPYMLCALFIFCYFCWTFYKYRVWPPKKSARAAVESSPSTDGDDDAEDLADAGEIVRNKDGKTFRLNRHYFDVEHAYVLQLLHGPRKQRKRARALLAAQAQDIENYSKLMLQWRRFVRWIETPHPVRLSTRLLIGVIMALEVAYVMSVVFCFHFAEKALDIVDPTPEQYEAMRALFIGTSTSSAVICFCIMLFQTSMTIMNFRLHIARLRRGDYSMVPGGREGRFDINDTIGFVGFTVGYGLVGFVYMFIVLELVMIFLWAIIYIPSVREFFWQQLVKEMLFLPLLSVMIFVQVQRLVSRRVFLPDQWISRFWTTKSALFTHYEYFMVFVNSMRGIISYLYSRLLTPLGFMVLFSTRMDKSMMVQGIEWMDEGFCNYIGMILADHHANNPVLVLFVQFLTITLENRIARGAVIGVPRPPPSPASSAAKKAAPPTSDDGHDDGDSDAEERNATSPLIVNGDGSPWDDKAHKPLAFPSDSPTNENVPLAEQQPLLGAHASTVEIPLRDSRIARNRWFLAVTLMNNPSLKAYRSDALAETARAAAEAAAEKACLEELLLTLPSTAVLPLQV